MAPKFCCCLPLRFGTVLITLFQFLLCGAISGLVWWLMWLANDRGALNETTRDLGTALIVIGAIYTFAAVIGLLGFFGAIFKKNGLVKTYLTLLYITLSLQIAAGIYALVQFYRFRHRDAIECVDGSTNQTRIDYCTALENFADAPAWSVYVSSIIPIVIVGYACYIVHSFSKRLAKQKADREIIGSRAAASGPAYSAVMPNEEHHPLNEPPSYKYPYADTPNSYGNNVSMGHAASYYDNSTSKV